MVVARHTCICHGGNQGVFRSADEIVNQIQTTTGGGCFSYHLYITCYITGLSSGLIDTQPDRRRLRIYYLKPGSVASSPQ